MRKKPSLSLPQPEIYSVRRKAREPLVDFMLGSLRDEGCRILYSSPPSVAPFFITFETPHGERLGIVAYAFFANSEPTTNRPLDEHRFQIKYGSDFSRLHELWHDPLGLYTTLLVGINPQLGFFVGADPTLHNPTPFSVSVEFKQSQVDQILKKGWHVWERSSRASSLSEPVEVLVGGTSGSFLRYIRFEREALGEDQGHRQLLAERNSRSSSTLHSLARELEFSEREVLDLIESANRLKVAVRGWAAEEHLVRYLSAIPGVRSWRIKGDGPDLGFQLAGSEPVTVECKNVLRKKTHGGLARLDFQRTRAAKSDPCSRYYSPKDFDLVAACLHAVTKRWEFRFSLTSRLDPHRNCPGKLSSNVLIDERWSADPVQVLRTAAARLS